MWLLDYLNPTTVFRKAQLTAKDLSNYLFYRKTIKKLEASGVLADKGMRRDMLCRVYFVINLLPETLLAGSDVDLLEKSRVTEAIAERNEIFTKDGLLEIVVADYERIKTSEYYAYLIWVKYRRLTKTFDWLHVVSWASLLIILGVNYHWFVELFNLVAGAYLRINN